MVCWVDDCLFFGPDEKKLDEVSEKIKGKGFDFTKEDTTKDVFTFLGVELTNESDKVILSQHNLIKKVLMTTKMEQCNPRLTPCTQDPLGTNAEGKRMTEEWSCPSVVGMLMHLCANACPEIQFAVHQCARFTHCCRQSHAEAVKKIVRYLKGVLLADIKHGKKHGLTHTKKQDFRSDCHVDADFAGLWNHEHHGDPVCVKSRTGHVMMLSDCPVHWVSKLQTEISQSTTEAECIALSQAMRELLPMRDFLSHVQQEMGLVSSDPIKIWSTVFEDNNGALSLAKSPKITPRTKHIGVKYHFFRSKIGEEHGILTEKMDTLEQIADIFTKGLPLAQFQALRKLLCKW